jgi:cysteinyl-tRNA synthetase
MSAAHLGETFDIHGGGIDLVFPHHENEIAQSCCAFGRDVMANYWMHNGFLQVEGEKMSKSLGNFVTIHELLHTERFGGHPWKGATLRLAMLRTHYRQPIDWTAKALEEADQELAYWVDCCQGPSMEGIDLFAFHQGEKFELPNDFIQALGDDLNTPEAIKVLRSNAPKATVDREACRSMISMISFLNVCDFEKFAAYSSPSAFIDVTPELALKLIDPERTFRVSVANGNLAGARRALEEIENLGAIVSANANTGSLQISGAKHRDSDVERFITARNAARASKNWAESDRIRDELAAMGIALKDNKDGTTTWEVKR